MKVSDEETPEMGPQENRQTLLPGPYNIQKQRPRMEESEPENRKHE